ncbi:MAG: cadherin-like domain-containing protein [Polaromonas sp.]
MYTGGSGKDTIVIEFTQAQWLDTGNQTQIANYLAHLAAVTNAKTGEVSNGLASDFVFTFGSSTLTVQMIETLRVYVEGYGYINLTGNDAPVSSNDSVTTLEDTTVILALSDFGSYSDAADGAAATAIAAVKITTLESDGSLEYYNGTTWVAVTLDQVVSAADISGAKLRFVPDGNENGAGYATIGFKVGDGTDFSASAYTLTINVTAVNDAPVLSDLSGTLAYTENAAAAAIDASITLVDVDDTQMASATVTISAGLTAGDVLGFVDGGGITGSYNSGTGVLSLSGAASKAAYEAALESVTYSSTSDDPTASSASRTISWTVTDANSDGVGAQTSAAGSSTINVTAVNDAPVNTVPGAQTTNEDTSKIITGLSVSDADSGASSITTTFAATHGTLSASTGVIGGAVVSGNGTASVTLTGTAAQINTTLAAAAGVTFAPTANFNGNALLTMTTNDGGNTGSGGPLVDTDTVAITISAVNDNPIAASDILYVSNSTAVTLPTSVLLANDTDIDGTALNVTAISVVTGTLATPVTINPDGTFSFMTGATGGTVASPTVVTLSYTLSDGAGGTATGSITLNVLNTDSGANPIDLTGVANYQGSYIDGKAGADTLSDGAFQSVWLGGSGNDQLNGNAGNDLLIGGDHNDTLSGGAGNDVLRGGQNNDDIDGGTGSEDLIDFSDAAGTTGITFALTQSTSNTTFNTPGGTNIGNDTYRNIEGVIGTSSADSLTGSAFNDILRGGAGNDTINGGAGTGDLIDFSDGTAGITFTLVNNGAGTVFNASAAGLGTDTYSGIEGVIGTAFADTLTGSTSADTLRGGGGNDTISGLGGNDRISGGAGADTLTGGTGALSQDTFVFDTAPNAVDTITDFEADLGDKIELSAAVFTGLATLSGPLSSGDFASVDGSGASASVGTAHVIYDNATGNLYYDADGGSSLNRTLFATLPNLTGTFDHNDITVGT